MRIERLKWFKHVKRRYMDATVKRYERLAIVGISRGRGRDEKLKNYGRDDSTGYAPPPTY